MDGSDQPKTDCLVDPLHPSHPRHPCPVPLFLSPGTTATRVPGCWKGWTNACSTSSSPNSGPASWRTGTLRPGQELDRRSQIPRGVVDPADRHHSANDLFGSREPPASATRSRQDDTSADPHRTQVLRPPPGPRPAQDHISPAAGGRFSHVPSLRPEGGRPFAANRVGVAHDHGRPRRSCHRRRSPPEDPGPEDEDRAAGDISGGPQDGRDGRGRTVRRGRQLVGQFVGQPQDGRPPGQQDDIGQPTRERPARGVAVLHQPVALLRYAVGAEEAPPTADGHAPGDSVAGPERLAGQVGSRGVRAEGLDAADNLVPQNDWRRLGPPAGVRVQVARRGCNA